MMEFKGWKVIAEKAEEVIEEIDKEAIEEITEETIEETIEKTTENIDTKNIDTKNISLKDKLEIIEKICGVRDQTTVEVYDNKVCIYGINIINPNKNHIELNARFFKDEGKDRKTGRIKTGFEIVKDIKEKYAEKKVIGRIDSIGVKEKNKEKNKEKTEIIMEVLKGMLRNGMEERKISMSWKEFKEIVEEIE